MATLLSDITSNTKSMRHHYFDHHLSASAGPKQHHFDPYSLNGGTILGIAGADFALVASDTRLCAGYSILSRDVSRLFQYTDQIVLGAGGGFHGDTLTLTKLLAARVKSYKYDHRKDISTEAFANMLSTMLYHRRFFPFYVYNIVAGLDKDGRGAVFGYDPVGSYQRNEYSVAGDGIKLIRPVLDHLVGGNNSAVVQPELTVDRALTIAKDAFNSAAEREINIGDSIDIRVITAAGVTPYLYNLRKD